MNMSNDDASTILLVEDDGATRTFLADNLAADGYDLLVADCATVGLSLIERKFPDLALLDVGLPDGSGHELMRLLRPFGPVRGIALSGYGTDEDVRRSREAGFDTHLTKPTDFQRLVDTIEQLST